MEKRIISIAFCVLLCAAGIVRGQNDQYSKQGLKAPSTSIPAVGSHNPPYTAETRAKMLKMEQMDEAAAVALDDGQYAEAEADAREALSIRMDSGIAQEVLASALNAQGKTDEALQAYKVMADRGGVFPRNMLPYALLLKTGHYAEAVLAYNKQLPYLDEGDLMRANSHFSPAVHDPVGLETAIHIALCLTDGTATWGGHMQDDKALAEVRQALALTPDSALANLYYGDALWRVSHRRAPMLAAYRKAAALGRGDVKAAAEKKLGVDTSGRS